MRTGIKTDLNECIAISGYLLYMLPSSDSFLLPSGEIIYMSAPGAEEMGYVLPGEAGVVSTDRSREDEEEQLVCGRERQRSHIEFKSKPLFLL